MVGSINSANLVRNASFVKQNTQTASKANEEATESISEKLAEAQKQSQSSTNNQAKSGHIDVRA